MDKEAWKDRWLRKKPAEEATAPLPHGGFVLGEALAAESTRTLAAEYRGRLAQRSLGLR